MSARERELGELPSPICPCLTARLGRDFSFPLRNVAAARQSAAFLEGDGFDFLSKAATQITTDGIEIAEKKSLPASIRCNQTAFVINTKFKE
jgi:hypothetical protein